MKRWMAGLALAVMIGMSPGGTTPAHAAPPTPTPAPAPVSGVQSGNVQDWNSLGLPAVIIAIIIATWLRRRQTSPPQEPDQSNSSGS